MKDTTEQPNVVYLVLVRLPNIGQSVAGVFRDKVVAEKFIKQKEEQHKLSYWYEVWQVE